jgi:hypothetical protein
MKAAVRPVRDATDVPVLHGIEMDVVDVPIEVGVISNGMLPVSTLPDALLAL